MHTKVIDVDDSQRVASQLVEAIGLLRDGEVVAVPTETVYGLAADALNPDAVAKIFEAKGRPSYDPLIVHLASYRAVHKVAKVPEEQMELFEALAEEFWPGPLTLVLPKQDCVPDIVTAGLPTVAVRISAHPVMRTLVREGGMPLAAPSANRFGKISPTGAFAVMSELDGKIPLILNSGACPEGIESTIIALEPPKKNKPIIRILRPGPVTREMLRPFGQVVIKAKPGEKVVAPGTLDSHYSPSKPFLLLDKPEDFVPEEGVRYGLLSYRDSPKDGFSELHEWTDKQVLSPGKGKAIEAATRLYFMMRKLDENPEVDVIISETVTNAGLGMAIADRLRRASAKKDS